MRKLLGLLLLWPALLAAQDQGDGYALRYWFDYNSTDAYSVTSGSPHISFEADATGLTEGLHILHFMVSDGAGVWSAVNSGMFLRANTPGLYTVQTLIDGEEYSLEEVNCGPDGAITMNLDLSGMSYGVHTFAAAVITDGGSITSHHEAMFVRVPTSTEMQGMKLHYIIDERISGTAECNPLSGVAHLDVDLSSLQTGIHSISMYMADGHGLNSSFRSALFVKLPENGGAIKEYRYWINDDFDNQIIVPVSEIKQTFSLIDMLDVPAATFRTKAFLCQPESDGSLTLTSQNDFNMTFIGEGGVILHETGRFADSRVTKTVKEEDITLIPSGCYHIEHLPRLEDGEISWLRFKGEVGSYFSIQADNACEVEVFSPDGSILYKADALISSQLKDLEISEPGTYYVAVHDFGANVNTVELNMLVLTRYAVVRWTPSTSANKGSTFVDIVGNGFNELKGLSLLNGDFKIESSFLHIKDNNNAMARFDLDSINAPFGRYDISAEYVDSLTSERDVVAVEQAIVLNDAEKAAISVEIVPTRRAASPYQVDFKVTNQSNLACSFVPLNLAVRQSERGFSIAFKNFYPHEFDPELSELFERVMVTDNLLNTGASGYFFPTIIPYIGPHETITLSIGVRSFPHEKILMYAWAGEPWSEEIRSMSSGDFAFTEDDVARKNYLSLKYLLATVFTEELESEQPQMMRAPNEDNNNNTNNSVVVEPDYRALQRMANMAQRAAQESRAIGMTLGGIENGLRIHNLDRTMEAYGIDPSDGTFSSLMDYRDDLRQNMPHPGEIAAVALGREDLWQWIMDRCPTTPNPMPEGVYVDCYQSGDPNDITGYTSPSGSKHIGLDVKDVTYTVEFENDPEIANASAITIDVETDVDGSRFDLASLVPGELRISNKTIALPARHHFVRTVDMRPEINAVAELTFDYDSSTGKVRWHLESLDPMTMEPTDYFEQGILPVNDDDHRGEGHVTYTVALKPGLPHGTEISSQAVIVFDTNEPIATPVWTNVTDYLRPEGRIVSQSTVDGVTYSFQAEGADTGAGMWRYELYGMAPGAARWQLLADSEEADFIHTAQSQLTGWRFAVLAVDHAGNRQDNAFMSLPIGDVNASGAVDVQDVVIMIDSYATGTADRLNLCIADVNADSRIDVQDAIMAQKSFLVVKNRVARQRKYPRKQ